MVEWGQLRKEEGAPAGSIETHVQPPKQCLELTRSGLVDYALAVPAADSREWRLLSWSTSAWPWSHVDLGCQPPVS